jgi:hypothetical protein
VCICQYFIFGFLSRSLDASALLVFEPNLVGQSDTHLALWPPRTAHLWTQGPREPTSTRLILIQRPKGSLLGCAALQLLCGLWTVAKGKECGGGLKEEAKLNALFSGPHLGGINLEGAWSGSGSGTPPYRPSSAASPFHLFSLCPLFRPVIIITHVDKAHLIYPQLSPSPQFSYLLLKYLS